VTTRFSIFIPVWNDARWLPGAIESVLQQTHSDWELIIGDNASTEDIEAIVSGYGDERIRYHRWPDHVDYAGNANRTIGLCRFEWLQYLSADDRLLPTCLERMADRVESASAEGRCLAMVLTACKRLDEQGRPAEQRYFGTWRISRLHGGILEPDEWLASVASPGAPPWNIGSLAISAETYRLMAGFYREEIGLTVDLEMATRAAAYGPVGYVDEPLLAFTVRGDSMTNTFSRRLFDRGAILPPVAAALLSALAVHEHRREVARGVRRTVMAQVADQLVGRALMHRYLDGGQGRRGALRDLLRATYHDPRWPLNGRQLVRATAALVAPGSLIVRVKRRYLEAGGYF
jgi:glycosyltransferase involved in cell wall biosynthesis